MLSPRLGVIVLWLFTDYINRAFDSWLWPLLGLIFLPWTTLMYILVAVPVGRHHLLGLDDGRPGLHCGHRRPRAELRQPQSGHGAV